MKSTLIALLLVFPALLVNAQKVDNAEQKPYRSPSVYPVPGSLASPTDGRVRNIILMIGDGMGISQVYAGMVANQGKLHMLNCPYTGFIKTNSHDNLITDSGAGGTALATGHKTVNGAIGTDPVGLSLKSILEIAEEHGLATGLVATCNITHATPASFIAHQSSRGAIENIALDFLKTEIDVFIGGGKKTFENRADGRNLIAELKARDYQIITSADSLVYIQNGKAAAFVADDHPVSYHQGRGPMLRDATSAALRVLSNNKKGFFLMIEGSQIDWGGHDNNTQYIVEETLDFDRAVGQVLDFAAADRHTLVIITADHETGGMGINQGDINSGVVRAGYTTIGHTGVPVPVFAFGPGAEDFIGLYENTDIFHKMLKAYGFPAESH